jgi:hypothetical protein
VIVTAVLALTARLVTVKFALVAPAEMVTLAGTVAAAVLLLDSATTAPPEGAPLVNVSVPWEELPPTTDAGFRLNVERLAVAGAVCGVKRRDADQLPATPEEFTARTRHQCCTLERPVTLICDAVDVRLRTSGAAKLLLSSIWMR